MTNLALNGFGRIGKTFLRTILLDKQAKEKLNVSVINIGKGDPEATALAFKYDTLMGTYPEQVAYKDNNLIIGNLKIPVISQLDPAKADWNKYEIDWVVEASGKFTHKSQAEKHLSAGAKKVLITAPAVDEDVTIIPGVNNGEYRKEYKIISLGSCTTNALAPMVKVLVDNFTVQKVVMTTVHAYTNSQALLDVDPNMKNPRRSRAAALNIVPSTTGATKVIGKVIPQVANKTIGHALRVPVGKESIIDLLVVIDGKADKNEINKLYQNASETNLKNILKVSYEPLVSSDHAGDPHSVIIDALLTQTLDNAIKVFGWYDNEWAYSTRLKDFLLSVSV